MWRPTLRTAAVQRAAVLGRASAAAAGQSYEASCSALPAALAQVRAAAAVAATVSRYASTVAAPLASASSRVLRPASGLLLPRSGALHGSPARLADSTSGQQQSPSASGSGSGSSILTNTSFVSAADQARMLNESPEQWLERDPRMLDCILVRHGESEGNIAYNRSWEGDHSLYTGAFLKRHSSLWRLTDRGRDQARTAGQWLRENALTLPDPFAGDPSSASRGRASGIYRYYVSEYIRAMETAALMELPEAKWFVEVQLRERDWGTFDIMSQKERVVRFSEETRRRDRDSLFYAPPGGESLVHVLSRVDGVLTNFNRQCANRRCIVVCHGEVMWAFRLRFERLSQLTYREMEAASSPYERIHNCIAAGSMISMADGRAVPIEQVAVGEEVLSWGAHRTAEGTVRSGLTPRVVTATLDRGQRDCIELTFEGGHTLICTPDHHLRTEQGEWVAAGELVVDSDAESGSRVCYRAVGAEGLNLDQSCSGSRVLPVTHPKLVGRRAVGLRHTYDLSVPVDESAPPSDDPRLSGTPSFVASGFVAHNCQILWYSRRNPFTGEISKFFQWKRSVCPWDLRRSRGEWEEIVRVEHTNDSLLAHVNRVKRIYGHEKSYRASTMPEEQRRILQASGYTIPGLSPATVSAASVARPTLQGSASDDPEGAAALAAAAPGQDPSVVAEINRLKDNHPVAAARAAKSTDDPSLVVPPMPASLASSAHRNPESLAFDPVSEDAHLPLTRVPPSVIGAEASAAARQAVAAISNPLTDARAEAAAEASAASAAASGQAPGSAGSAEGEGQGGVVVPAPPAWTPAPGWPFLSAHPRVLVLTKTPRYEHEKNATGLQGQDLHAELSKLGFVSDRLVQSYVRHMEGLAQLTLALQQHSMKVIVKHVDSATHADLEGIDLILSAGGDGTMLKAAALLGYHHLHKGAQPTAQPFTSSTTAVVQSAAAAAVPTLAAPPGPPPTDNSSDEAHAAFNAAADALDAASSGGAAAKGDEERPYIPIPLIGVNTDPQHSSGVLCAFSIEGPHTAIRVIEHLRKSHFVWVEKSRIELTLVDKWGQATSVGQYAYNDVVVAERDPGRPIVYELTVDEHPAEIQRSSGVLVCTGTGSTAWMANAAGLHPDQVAAVLRDVGYTHTAADTRAIADRINQQLVFESNSPEVQYFVREPLLPLATAASVGARGGYQHRHGWAGRVAVRSLGWDAVLSIDGINLVQLPKGTTAVLRIGRKPGANLMVLSLAGTGGEPFSRQ